MTNEEYFGSLKMMFSTEGWGVLLGELKNNAGVINDIQAASDENDLHFRKGQLAILGYLLNLEETIARMELEEIEDAS